MKRAHVKATVLPLFILMVSGWLSASTAHAENIKNIGGSGQMIPPASVESATGNGFRKGAENLAVTLCSGLGVKIFGSEKKHDLLLFSSHWGKIATSLVGDHHWYRGHLERWSELFGGFQYQPHDSYVIGGAIGLRYHFITGSRWTPFLDTGAGVAATDIGKPDLGSTFEFNLQVGAGIHYFINKTTALGVQLRWFHLSNGGLTRSNMGANSLLCLCGLSWFF